RVKNYRLRNQKAADSSRAGDSRPGTPFAILRCSMMIRMTTVLGACLVFVLGAAPVSAQTPTDPSAPPVTAPPPPDPSAPAPAPPPQAGAPSDPATRLDPLQPDFVLSALPTTLRLPEHKLAFMVTHRFNRPLGLGDFGDLLSNFFGFDNGAQIGLELRYG